MQNFVLLAVAFAEMLVAGVGSAAEIRIYRFIPDGSLPYSASCGECGPPHIGAASDIAGTFTLALDFEESAGSLVGLNDRLVNYFDALASPSGPILEPATPLHAGIIPSWAAFFAPPFDGTLESTSSGFTLSSLDPAHPFEIVVSGTNASFNLTVPIDDYFITVTNAVAVQVPEPSSISIAVIPVAMLAFAFRGGVQTLKRV
jgi:hypothetical protein